MDFKKLKINAASVALSVALTSSSGLVLAQPVFAADEELNEEVTVEEVIDEEVKTEEVKQEEAKQEETKEDVKQEEVKQEETKEDVKQEEVKQEETKEEAEEVVKEETKEEVQEKTKEEAEEVENTAKSAGKTAPSLTGGNEQTIEATTSQQHEVHKVQTTTSKLDEDGIPLAGSLLQILDSEGNVVDEWVSDGTDHISMLPEGDYVLHEVAAPNGYIKAADKPFTIKVEVKDLNAGVDFSETPCEHYGGTPLYYIEMESQKSEVYCINQD